MLNAWIHIACISKYKIAQLKFSVYIPCLKLNLTLFTVELLISFTFLNIPFVNFGLMVIL
jgi:hypothetical protein